MSGDQKPLVNSFTVWNLPTVTYETQGLAYGGRFSGNQLTVLTAETQE